MIIVDNGETVIDRAARVRRDFEGKGVYKFLLSEVDKIHKKQGQVTRHAMVTVYEMQAPNQLHMKRAMNLYTFTIEQGVTKGVDEFLQTNQTLLLTEEMPRAALDQRFSSYLFPQNRIMVDWVPFRLLETNVPLLPKSTYASNLRETSSGKVSGLLSAFVAYEGRKEGDIICNLDLFGSDLETLEDHVAVHLKQLKEYKTGYVYFRVFLEQCIESEVVDKLFTKIGAEKIVSGPLYASTTFLYERST